MNVSLGNTNHKFISVCCYLFTTGLTLHAIKIECVLLYFDRFRNIESFDLYDKRVLEMNYILCASTDSIKSIDLLNYLEKYHIWGL